MIVRIYAGNDGESHFEDLTADQFADIANDVGPGDITVGQRPAGWWQDYHTAPAISTWCSCLGARRSRSPAGPNASSAPAMCWWRRTSPVMGTSFAISARNPAFRWPCP